MASNTILKAIAQQGPTTPEALDAIVGFRSCGLKEDAALVLEEVKQIMEKAGS